VYAARTVSRAGFVSYLFGFGILLIAAAASLRGALTRPEAAVRALEAGGYRGIKVGARKVFLVGARGCSPQDAARYDATAVDAKGANVSIYVCVGWPVGESTVHPIQP
jgi:hypothetical protein